MRRPRCERPQFVPKASIREKVNTTSYVEPLTFKERVRKNVSPESILITDNHRAYLGLASEYHQHEIINHIEDEYERDGYHTNTIEGFWSQLKRTIKGTHIHVSKEHLQKYVDEVAFRYMHRNNQDFMFEAILRHAA